MDTWTDEWDNMLTDSAYWPVTVYRSTSLLTHKIKQISMEVKEADVSSEQSTCGTNLRLTG